MGRRKEKEAGLASGSQQISFPYVAACVHVSREKSMVCTILLSDHFPGGYFTKCFKEECSVDTLYAGEYRENLYDNSNNNKE